MERKSRQVFVCLYGLSGACGLVYEVIWSRWLALLWGNTSAAHTVVITTFLAGLACGYWIGGGLISRRSRGVLVYGVLELCIGAWAFLVPWIYAWVEQIPVLDGSGGTLSLCVASAAMMLVPTALMGMTFPFALKALVDSRTRTPGDVALLYAVNSGGAVLGALVCGFLLIEWAGLSKTNAGTGVVNVVIGLSALYLAPKGSVQPKEEEGAPTGSGYGRLALVSAALFGFVSLTLQAVWIRFFAVSLGSSTYAFSTVLAAFVAGIALGSHWVRRQVSSPLRLLLYVTMACAITLLALGPFLERLPYLFGSMRLELSASGATFPFFVTARFVLTFVVLLLPTALFGAALPLAARLGGETPASSARVFAFNTAAAVVGAGTALPVFVPALGLDSVYGLSISLLGALGLYLWKCEVSGRLLRTRERIVGLLFALLLVLGLFSHWDPHVLSAGTFRSRSLPASFDTFVSRLHKGTILFYEDGPDASVAVVEKKGGRVLRVNGKPDASTRGDMLTQVMSGHLPLLLHPKPEDTLVIGLGSGVTAYSASLHGGNLDVVEISGGVVEAASYFGAVNHGVLDAEGVQVIEADARGFLRGVEDEYDVIISEPSNPWVAGNAGLFSVEFFEQANRSLRKDGVLAQWFHIYEMDDATLSLVFESIRSVFPHVSLWEMFPNDLLLIATREPLELRSHEFSTRFHGSKVAEDLAQVAILSPAGLLSRHAVSGVKFSNEVKGDGLVNTDDRPLLEYRAPRGLYTGGRATLVSQWTERKGMPGAGALLLDQWVQTEGPLTVAQAEELFVLHTIYPGASVGFLEALLPRMVAESSPSFLVDLLFTLVAERREMWVLPVMKRLWKEASEQPDALYALAWALEECAANKLSCSFLGATKGQLLERCIEFGDDSRGRCARLLATTEKG